jgi:hypothetical protein
MTGKQRNHTVRRISTSAAVIIREAEKRTKYRERPRSVLRSAEAGRRVCWSFKPEVTSGSEDPSAEPQASRGAEKGRKADAVGDSFCSALVAVVAVVVPVTKGSFSRWRAVPR